MTNILESKQHIGPSPILNCPLDIYTLLKHDFFAQGCDSLNHLQNCDRVQNNVVCFLMNLWDVVGFYVVTNQKHTWSWQLDAEQFIISYFVRIAEGFLGSDL